MFCCGIDPSLAAWMAETDNFETEREPGIAALLILAAASIALALVAAIGHG